MKLELIFKTPDILDNTLYDMGMTKGEIEDIENQCKKWIRYGEYITVEIDLDKQTCEVIPNNV